MALKVGVKISEYPFKGLIQIKFLPLSDFATWKVYKYKMFPCLQAHQYFGLFPYIAIELQILDKLNSICESTFK